MNAEWSSTTKHIVGVGLVLFALYIIFLSQSVLTIAIIAALIAFLLMPMVEFLHQRLKLSRGLAVIITYLVTGIVLFLSPLVFLPPLINGINTLANIDYQVLVQDTSAWLQTTLLQLKNQGLGIGRFSVDLSTLIDPALQMLQATEAQTALALPSSATIVSSVRSAVTLTYDLATNVAGTLFSGVLTMLVLVLSAVYISLDAHQFKGYVLGIVPASHQDEIDMLLHRLARTWRAYFRGQLILMVIIGVVTWLGNMVLGVRGAFALGVFAGIMELIPNLGPFLAAVPAVIVALLQGSTVLPVSNWVFALIIIGFYLLVQQFENTFVVPRILGEAVDLHALVVMLGVLIGANVAGIVGALLAAPVIASGREITRYLYLKTLGLPPFPPEPEPTGPPSPSLWQQGMALAAALKVRLTKPAQSPPPSDESLD